MNSVFSDDFFQYKDAISNITKNFKNGGIPIGPGARNVVKVFEIDGKKFNFKSFKQHNIINRHVYKYYRKSKSKRSFEYAEMLLSKGFHTPKPVAFIENHDLIGVTSSYYISVQLEDCFPLSDPLYNPDFFDREKIFRDYAKLIFELHQTGIEFIDNASGNFLIKKQNGQNVFYLVDLNRMNFHKDYPIEKRLKNFARLTDDFTVLTIICEEYAKLSGVSTEFCLQKIKTAFSKRSRKNKIKKILKFYKYFLPKN